MEGILIEASRRYPEAGLRIDSISQRVLCKNPIKKPPPIWLRARFEPDFFFSAYSPSFGNLRRWMIGLI